MGEVGAYISCCSSSATSRTYYIVEQIRSKTSSSWRSRWSPSFIREWG